MRKHWQYLKYVLRHKWFVFRECLKMGIPLRGITHDLSKFRPREWFPYVERFYGKNNDVDEAMQDLSYQLAWLHHQKRNDHHWQYWILNRDSGEKLVLPMSDKSRREMLADWIGAGKAIHGENDVVKWYEENKENMQLHQETQEWIDNQIKLIKQKQRTDNMFHSGLFG